jgi:hypothetical protein
MSLSDNPLLVGELKRNDPLHEEKEKIFGLEMKINLLVERRISSEIKMPKFVIVRWSQSVLVVLILQVMFQLLNIYSKSEINVTEERRTFLSTILHLIT